MIPPTYFPFPREERKISSEESTETSEESNDKSEEFFLSSLGNKKYPRKKSQNSSEESVLFLKKVHSWGGITETVHGSFLLVLRVYSFVSFAPAGVHDLWSSLLRRYTKIGLCVELSGMGSEF